MDLGLSFLNPIAKSDEIDHANAQEDRAKALAPIELAHKAALGRLANSQAEKAETENAGEKRAAALMADRFAKNPTTGAISDELYSQANIFAQAGLPVKADAALKAASEAQAHEATARAAIVRQQTEKFQGAEKTAKIMSSLADNVKDEASWNAANSAYKEITGQDSPFAKYAYDPKAVEMIKSAGMTMAEKAAATNRAAALSERIANDRARLNLEGAKVGIQERRLDLARQREERVAKVGGKDIGAPGAGELKGAKTFLASEPGLVPQEQLDTAAFDVASQARALRKSNPGMSADDALRKTIQDKKDAGDFQPEEKAGGLKGVLGLGTKPAAYKPPKPAPATIDQLVVGEHYKNPKTGAVMEWQGKTKGWKPVGPSKPAAGGSSSSPDDGEDDE